MIQYCDSASVDEQLRTSTVVSPDFLSLVFLVGKKVQ